MEISIQKATLQDLPLLMEWRMEVLHEVFALPLGLDTRALEDANRMYYTQCLPNESHVACFALQKSNIVGCGGICFYQEMPSPDNPTGWCGYLMNIYTRPAFRGNSVGRSIVQWLTAQAAQKGVTKIYLETSDAGRSLYQSMGFQAMPDQMQLGKEFLTESQACP